MSSHSTFRGLWLPPARYEDRPTDRRVLPFYAVWSSRSNGTLYYDLHGTNDVSVRVFTFTQMLAVAVMAINPRGAGGPSRLQSDHFGVAAE